MRQKAAATYCVALDLGITHSAAEAGVDRKVEGLDEEAAIQRCLFKVNGLRFVVDSSLAGFRIAFRQNARQRAGIYAVEAARHSPVGISLKSSRPFLTGAMFYAVTGMSPKGQVDARTISPVDIPPHNRVLAQLCGSLALGLVAERADASEISVRSRWCWASWPINAPAVSVALKASANWCDEVSGQES